MDGELWIAGVIAFGAGFLFTIADPRLGRIICVIEALIICAASALLFTAFGFEVLPAFLLLSAFPWIGFYAGLRFNKWLGKR
ncbi:hypothetical protein [Sphingopyxis fribergensis]